MWSNLGASGAVSSFEMPLVKHPVCFDGFPLDWRYELVEDDAAEAAVDAEHGKDWVSPDRGVSCHSCLVEDRSGQVQHLGDDR